MFERYSYNVALLLAVFLGISQLDFPHNYAAMTVDGLVSLLLGLLQQSSLGL